MVRADKQAPELGYTGHALQAVAPLTGAFSRHSTRSLVNWFDFLSPLPVTFNLSRFKQLVPRYPLQVLQPRIGNGCISR